MRERASVAVATSLRQGKKATKLTGLPVIGVRRRSAVTGRGGWNSCDFSSVSDAAVRLRVQKGAPLALTTTLHGVEEVASLPEKPSGTAGHTVALWQRVSTALAAVSLTLHWRGGRRNEELEDGTGRISVKERRWSASVKVVACRTCPRL